MQMTEFNHNYVKLGLNFIGNTATRKTQCKTLRTTVRKLMSKEKKHSDTSYLHVVGPC